MFSLVWCEKEKECPCDQRQFSSSRWQRPGRAHGGPASVLKGSKAIEIARKVQFSPTIASRIIVSPQRWIIKQSSLPSNMSHSSLEEFCIVFQVILIRFSLSYEMLCDGDVWTSYSNIQQSLVSSNILYKLACGAVQEHFSPGHGLGLWVISKRKQVYGQRILVAQQWIFLCSTDIDRDVMGEVFPLNILHVITGKKSSTAFPLPTCRYGGYTWSFNPAFVWEGSAV